MTDNTGSTSIWGHAIKCRIVQSKSCLGTASLAGAIVAVAALGPRQAKSEPVDSVPTILYVDDDAPLNGTGSSWSDAHRFLQDALFEASKPGSLVTEIRLGQGNYKADQGQKQIAGDVNASFALPTGVALRGAFAGFGARNPDARDYEKFQTILSGDLLGNDGPPGNWLNYADNTRHIITFLSSGTSNVLEGLIVMSSQTDQKFNGGGLTCLSGNLTLSHCTFKLNRAHGSAGALLVHCNATIEHCRFDQNSVTAIGQTGALLLSSSNTIMSDCEFVGNRTQNSDGGAVYAYGGTISISRCLFLQNFSGDRGGAIFSLVGSSNITIDDCQFVDNLALWSGGAVFGSIGKMTGCTFDHNITSSYGGGVHGIGTIINCRFVRNSASSWSGGGFCGTGTVINCQFISNTCGGPGIGGGAAGICIYTGGLFDFCSLPTSFVNCLFNSNQSLGPGGAVNVWANQSASFINCTFTQNIAQRGQGGSVSGNAQIYNSILWNNWPAELEGSANVGYSCVRNGWPGMGNIQSDPMLLDVLGPDGVIGTVDDNLRLAPHSSCIDAADRTVLPLDSFDLNLNGDLLELLPVDLDGNIRQVNDPATPSTGNPLNFRILPDMGAFEFNNFRFRLGDINRNGVVNVDDLLAVINGWGECPRRNASDICPPDIDGNGVVNMHDLQIVLQNWD